MIPCKNCETLIGRKEANENDGSCGKCTALKIASHKISSDLLTSFSGKGRRGFVQWLKLGKFLHNIENDADIHAYNDRVNVIRQLIGGEDKYDRLIDVFSRVVLEVAKEETKADD